MRARLHVARVERNKLRLHSQAHQYKLQKHDHLTIEATRISSVGLCLVISALT